MADSETTHRGTSKRGKGMKESDNVEVRLRLVEVATENLDLQNKRFVSHLESEQRVSQNQGKLIDANTRTSETQQKILEKHELILLNSGRGILFRIDRLEQRNEGSKNRLYAILSIVSVIISAIMMLYTFFGSGK